MSHDRDGPPASAAAVLLLAGAPGKRFALPNSRVLLHRPTAAPRAGGRHRIQPRRSCGCVPSSSTSSRPTRASRSRRSARTRIATSSSRPRGQGLRRDRRHPEPQRDYAFGSWRQLQRRVIIPTRRTGPSGRAREREARKGSGRWRSSGVRPAECSFFGKSQKRSRSSSPAPACTSATSASTCATRSSRGALRDRRAEAHETAEAPEIFVFLDEYVVGQDQARRFCRSPSITTTSGSRSGQGRRGRASEVQHHDPGPDGAEDLPARRSPRLLNVPFAIADATALTEAG